MEAIQCDCKGWIGFTARASGIAINERNFEDMEGCRLQSLDLLVCGVPLNLSYQILVASDEAGLIETIPDSISIHSIKKDGYANGLNQKGVAFTLYDYFVKEFGDPGSESFLEAQDNFMRSLAGYCLISYILQVKV